MNFLSNAFLWVGILAAVVATCAALGYVINFFVPLLEYAMYWFAKRDWFWTIMGESTAKIVTRFGAYHKTLLQKRGYKLAAEDILNEKGEIVIAVGDIVIGNDPDQPLPGGLRYIGWPFIYKIFRMKKMNWTKSLPNGTIEDRNEENVPFMLALVDYPYGLKFEKAEDNDLLPLDGKMTLTAAIVNPYKAMFAVTDWFAAMTSRVLPHVREFITRYTYEDMMKKKPSTSTSLFGKCWARRDPTA